MADPDPNILPPLSEKAVDETVYMLHGISSLLEDLDMQVIRPIAHHRYKNHKPDTPPPPKFISLRSEPGCGRAALCSALVNELRRGRLNKRSNIHYENRKVKYIEWRYGRFNDPTVRIRSLFEDAAQSEFTVLVIPDFHLMFPAGSPTSLSHPRYGYFQQIKLLFIQQLDGIPPGKILIVACMRPTATCDADISQRLEQNYVLSRPDEVDRAEIISKTLDESLMEISIGLLNKVVESTEGLPTEDLLKYIREAIAKAERRQNNNTARPGEKRKIGLVIVEDWSQTLGLNPNPAPLPQPAIRFPIDGLGGQLDRLQANLRLLQGLLGEDENEDDRGGAVRNPIPQQRAVVDPNPANADLDGNISEDSDDEIYEVFSSDDEADEDMEVPGVDEENAEEE